MDFRYRLINLRRESNLTGEELGKKLGLTKTAISLWESGKNQPNINVLIKLCDIFNCSLDYLVGRTDQKYMFTKLNEKHDFFIPNFENLSKEEQELIVNVATTLAEKYLKDKN